jgi:hypothetical protein
MHNIISHPPDGTATPGEPRDLRAITEQGALLVNCGICWQRPGQPCNRFYPPGSHLARFQRAERRGLISRAELASVVAGLDVIAPAVIIPDVRAVQS